MRQSPASWIVATFLIAGCADSPDPVDAISAVEQSAAPREVTLFLPGMNKGLKIL